MSAKPAAKKTAAAPRRIAPNSAEAKALATYKVTKRIDHDGERYEADDTIELDGRAAEQLLEVGAIEPMLAKADD